MEKIVILIDTEFVSITGQPAGVIFRVAILVWNIELQKTLEEYDIWVNYNLYKMYPNVSVWRNQLRWINSNEKYNAGYVIRPIYRTGQTINQVRRHMYNLVKQYGVSHVYAKGASETDKLITRMPIVEIQSPNYEEKHEPLKELHFYKFFI